MSESNPDTGLYLLFGLLALIVLIVLLVSIGLFFSEFSHELTYLNNEIRRTRGRERRHYIRRRRRLWLSLLPFFRY